ncbi:putative pectinesterase [Arachis hypogaea]|nr:putative pectinesterase [Arachis hypogaea]
MLLFLVRWWIYVFVLLNSGAVNSQNYRTVRDKILPFNKVVVDSLGHGNFSTIQSAIDSVPSNNKYWILINVTAGIYREKVTIPIDKPYIILKGSGKMRTWVEWDDHNTTAQSPTVGFFGLQDTLWDNYGKHYYKFCTIEGAVDFIFGAGQSLFERCSINVIGRALGKWFVGYITAQARENPKDSNGFVFKNCNVSGNGSTFLGRPWRPYAKVLFYNTSMANIIQPAGWDLWDSSQHE